ncbi:SLBB domain-containing protein, partial [SAR116 cluster bacterium]|nr:SLBB domain-containing protein [SAR116 cluster bacterium]
HVVSPGKYIIGGVTEVEKIIDYSGGYISNSQNINVEISNRTSISNKSNKYIYPGEKVFINFNKSYNNIELTGAFKNNRSISFKDDLKLSDVLNNQNDLNKDSYLYFATIQSERTGFKDIDLSAFSPISVIKKQQDSKLYPGDVVKIYTNEEVQELLNKFSDQSRTLTPQLSFDQKSNLPLINGDITELIKSLSLRVEGGIVKPGQLLVASPLSIEDLITILGGFSNDAKIDGLEVIFPIKDKEENFILETKTINFNILEQKNLLVYPGSLLRVPKVKNDLSLGYIELAGEVNQPGKYRILDGDTIFDILKRSGGLNKDAYLKGLVFSRKNEQVRERAALTRLKRELEKAVLVAIENQGSSNRVSLADINSLRELIIAANKFEPIGRVIGNFDNIDVLKNTPVISGDKIKIPLRPNSVTVVGEVMSPGSIIWKQKNDTRDYIQQAAGFTDLAETKRIFVISPNGQATRSSGLWNQKNDLLPGSTIVVPRRIQLSNAIDRISAITSVIYQLTVTLAGIDNLLGD